jgi:hypothetical protein
MDIQTEFERRIGSQTEGWADLWMDELADMEVEGQTERQTNCIHLMIRCELPRCDGFSSSLND